MSYRQLHEYLEKNGYERFKSGFENECFDDFEQEFEIKGKKIKVRVIGLLNTFYVQFVDSNKVIHDTDYKYYDVWEVGLKEINKEWGEKILGRKKEG